MIFLYVKTHNKTGLKYFGKTTRDPHKYQGSGKYWKRHIKKYGNDVTTEIIGSYQDEIECENVAIEFSQTNNIVESNEWANLQDENGRDGKPVGSPGHTFSNEQRETLSKKLKERWANPEYKQKMKDKHRQVWSDERKEAQSARLTGKSRPDHSAIMKSKPKNDNFKRTGMTDDHRRKISEALRGKPKSDSHKQNLRKSKINCRRQKEDISEILP